MNDAQNQQPENSKPIALVTGSSKGIGAAIAFALAKRGMRIILHGRRESDHLVETQRRVQASGAEVKIVTCDFSKPKTSLEEHLCELATTACDQFGSLDVLVNNAGGDVLTGEARNWSFETQLEYLLQVDVSATLLLSRIIGKRMKEAGDSPTSIGKSIVNIGWDQAQQGMEGDSGEMFATTKGAIMAMTRSLAQSLGPEVRVNCVAPGWIQTEWGDTASSQWQQRAINESLMQRWGEPKDVANAVSFLASHDAKFISGQIIPVNGGFKYFQAEQKRS